MFMTSRRRSGWGTFAMLLAGLGLVVVMPFRLIDRVPTPVVAAPSVQVAPKPLCLVQRYPFSHFGFPVDAKKWGPGKEYKRFSHDFGYSAVPPGIEQMSPAQALAAVRAIYSEVICGTLAKDRGGNPQIYQEGLLTLDPTHNINEPVTEDWRVWALGVEGYLSRIVWEQSYVEQQTMPSGMVTLTMRAMGGPQPSIYALETQHQPDSWYLMLAVRQADGSITHSRYALACLFQLTFDSREDVPPGVPFIG